MELVEASDSKSVAADEALQVIKHAEESSWALEEPEADVVTSALTISYPFFTFEREVSRRGGGGGKGGVEGRGRGGGGRGRGGGGGG
jgi:hypothetical protein